MDARRAPPPAQLLLPLVGAVGLAASVLLTREYLGSAAHICGPGGGCDAVRESSFASLLGVPTPLFGVGFFGLLIALAAASGRARVALPWLGGAGAVAGAAFLALQGAVIGAFCWLCVVADVAAIAALPAAFIAVRASEPARSQRALGTAAAVALAGLFALGGGLLFAGPPPPPEGVILLDELPPPVAAAQEEGRVTIIEFMDFQCPHCRRLHGELTHAIRPYGDRVRVVHKHVPLPGHPHSLPAAAAAVCAGEMGRGPEMIDALFAADLERKSGERVAKELGLDREAFESCLASERPEERITADLRDARAAEVGGLPTFFIDRERFEGARPAGEIADSIERALRRQGI